MPEIMEATALVVSAYLGNHAVAPNDIPALINSIWDALTNPAPPPPPPKAAKPVPAVPLRQSIHLEYLVCLEDGKHLKMLKRYLRSRYDMSPQDYRRKWGLPSDYPMVAPAYSQRRSDYAKASGLGRSVGRGTKVGAKKVRRG